MDYIAAVIVTVILVAAAIITATVMWNATQGPSCPAGTTRVLTGQVTVPVKGIPMDFPVYQCQ